MHYGPWFDQRKCPFTIPWVWACWSASRFCIGSDEPGAMSKGENLFQLQLSNSSLKRITNCSTVNYVASSNQGASRTFLTTAALCKNCCNLN